MGALFDAKVKIEQVIVAQALEPKLAMGKIGLRCGFLLAFVKADTPDDADKLSKLKAAAQDVLGIAL